MSASETQICNLALMKFGNISIASVDDDTKEARACKVFFPLLRDELVYSHPWNFAMKRADISASLTTTPAFGFDYAYTVPADCLRVWEFYGYDGDWVVENGILLTDADAEIYIRYIYQVTQAGKFNASFVQCLATRLAAELATKLSDDKNMRAALLSDLYKVEIPRAYALNAMEGTRPLHKDEQPLDKGNFAWQTEGH